MSSTTPHHVSTFILILIVVLGLVAGYFYYVQVVRDESFEVPISPALQDSSFLKFKDLHFDFALFSSNVFTSLKTIGEYPVQPGLTGKQDPFAPF
ncbi:MAG: hypothetical protein AAB420_03065 [Patescibacteria group bacterium]